MRRRSFGPGRVIRRGRAGHHFGSKELTPRLTWEVERNPIITRGVEAEGYKALHRNDNGGLLNIVSNKYNPGTNERFMEAVNRLHEFTGFKIEGYSEFQGGKKVLAFLKNTEPVKVAGFETNNFMVLGNSFDYSTAWFTGSVNEVVRCTNAFGRISVKHKFRHNSQLDKNIGEMEKFYQGYLEEERRLQGTFEVWQGIRMPEELKELFADHVLDIEDPKEASAIKTNQRRNLFESINREIADMGDNLYGMFNGLTHYTTHKAASREKVFGNVLGHTANLNKKGFDFIQEYVLEHA